MAKAQDFVQKREYKRIRPPTEIRATSLNGIVLEGVIRDLSEGGVKVAYPLPTHYQQGHEINIAFMISDPATEKRWPIFARGQVVWWENSVHQSFLGVKFIELLETHRSYLRDFIQHHTI